MHRTLLDHLSRPELPNEQAEPVLGLRGPISLRDGSAAPDAGGAVAGSHYRCFSGVLLRAFRPDWHLEGHPCHDGIPRSSQYRWMDDACIGLRGDT